MIDFTVDAMIEDIKRHGSIPSNQRLLSDEDFLDFLNHNQRVYMIPAIMKNREEFFVSTFDQPVNANGDPYELPERGIAHKIRKACLVDANNNETMLPRIEPENKIWNDVTAWWPGSKSGYYFEGEQIFLTPNMNISFSILRLKYFRKPNWLTFRENCAQVTAIDTGTGVITCDSLPSTFVNGFVIDFIKSKPTFRSHSDDVTISAVSGSQFTVSLDVAAKIEVGDYACPAGESCVAQYPEELYPILTQLGLVDALKAMKDSEGAQAAESELAEMEESLNTLISNRDQGAPRKIVSRRGLWNTGGY